MIPQEKENMIIPEIKCRPMMGAVIFFFLLALPLFGQALQPAPTFQLLSSGYGAKALGLGGAFVAVADDLTAIYWNPAGLGQLGGIQLHADYRFQGDSDEDIAAEVQPDIFESSQRYSLSGNQFQSVSASYAIVKKDYAFVPAFSWQRLSSLGPERTLKETAGLVSFIDPRKLIFVQSEGDYREEFRGGEDELAFGMGVRVKQHMFLGGSWSLLRGGVDDRLTGNFHDNFIPGIDQPNVRQDISLQQSRDENLSGNYFRFGLLYAEPWWSIGSYVRLPYTRKSDITLDRTGTVITNGAPAQLNETATAQSEVDVPAEWGGAISIRPHPRNMITGSITYANWSDAKLTVANSSNILLIPETTVSYPTLRPTAGPQHSLLQLRAGTEYMLAGDQLNGVALRAGIFRDGQPYANEGDSRVKFKGYTFGAGYVSKTFHLNVAWIREKGNAVFTPFSRGESNFVNQRWIVSVDFIGW
jgi:long-chain fatty acid transport protein